jgi:hypothetical protein
MSTIETILTRAMSDPAFADLLFADVEKALVGYDLTPEELTSLKSISHIEIDKFAAASPEERKSFSIHLVPGNSRWNATTLKRGVTK